MREKKNIVELTRFTPAEYALQPKIPVTVALDNVRSLHNVGAVFRTVDSLGMEGVVLGGITGCPPHPELAKTALGAEKNVEWRHTEDLEAECRRLKSKGWTIAVLEQAHDSTPLQDYCPGPGQKILLVAGNEVEGVDQNIVSQADVVLEIPQRGVKHSLNVSVSIGMALWQIYVAEPRSQQA